MDIEGMGGAMLGRTLTYTIRLGPTNLAMQK